MKCSYCGYELPDGAEFCENCGMIMGFGDEKKEKAAEKADLDEYTPNIFEAIDFEEEDTDIAAMELPASDNEETVEVTHNIPEYVSSPEDEIVADYTDEPEKAFEESEKTLSEAIEALPAVDEIPAIEADFEAPEYTPVPDVVISAKMPSDAIKESNQIKKEPKKKRVYAETYNIENIPLENEPKAEEKIAEEEKTEATAAPVIIPVVPITPEENAEILAAENEIEAEAEAVQDITEPEVIEETSEPAVAEEPEIVEEVSEPEFEAEPEIIGESAAEPEVVEEITEAEAEEYEEVIEPTEEPVAVGIFEDIGAVSDEEEEYEDITPTEEDYSKPKKSGKGLVIAALILVLCVLCAGAYALKDYIPEILPSGTSPEESTFASTEEPSEEDTTDAEETTEEDTTEETTEETTEAEETTAEAEETTTEAEEDTTETPVVVPSTKPTTTKPTTTKPVVTTKPTTTKPVVTTKPTTTKPVVTTKPSTTKPTTTKPNTTTDPYGINDVTVKKPSSYIKSYTGYATAEGLNMRAKPDVNSPRVLFLSKGADVKVLAKEGGFLYVYSNRYGVYGWVSASYISTSRPTETTSKLYTGTVQPDVKTEAKTMHTTYSLNIRKGPATSYDSVQIIATGYPVKVLGSKSGVSGWVYVTDLTYGVSGWVSTAYLK